MPPPPWLRGYRDTARYNVASVGNAVMGMLNSAPKLLSNGIRRPVLSASLGSGDGRLRLPTVRPVNQNGFAADEAAQPDPAPRRAGGPVFTASGRRPPRRRCVERCLRRGRGRRAAPVPRKHGAAVVNLTDDADEPARRGRRDGRQPGHVDAVRRAGRRLGSSSANPPDP